MKILNVKGSLTQEEVDSLVKDEKLSKSAKVKVLFDHGYEVKEIAVLLNIRYNFAYNVIQNYVIVNDVAVEQNKKESKSGAVKALFDQGKSIGDVSKELKMNYNYVWKLHKEWAKEAEAEVKKTEEQSAVAGE